MDLATIGWVFALVLVVFAGAIGAMALGQRLSGRCMRGSCGGPAVSGPDGESLGCRDCPNRSRT